MAAISFILLKMTNNKPSLPNNKPPAAQKQKTPRRITATYLHNAGLHYLGRFASSTKNFRNVMLRKVKKSCAHHTDQDYERCAALVGELITKFEGAGLLNDELYARGLVTSLRRSGKSQKMIMAKMTTKGIASAMTKEKLLERDEEAHNTSAAAETQAALAHARKKKLGPFRGEKSVDPKKELSAMARAGFNYETSRRVLMLDLDDIEELA